MRGPPKDDAQADLIALGAPPELVAEAAAPAWEIEVLEENWTTVEVFQKLVTQFVWVQGACVGLNYQSIEFLFKLFDIHEPREVFERLQIMERAAREAFNSKDEAQ